MEAQEISMDVKSDNSGRPGEAGLFAAIAPRSITSCALVDVRGRSVRWRSEGVELWSTRVDVGFATALIRRPSLGSVVSGVSSRSGRGAVITVAAVDDDGALLWRSTSPARSHRARALLLAGADDSVDLVITDDGRILNVDRDGRFTEGAGSSRARPNAAAVAPLPAAVPLSAPSRSPSTIYLCDAAADTVLRLDAGEKRLRVHSRLPRGSWPMGIACDRRGTVIVACAGAGSIAVIDGDGRTSWVPMPAPSRPTTERPVPVAPTDVLSTPDGIHLVGGGSLWRLDGSTSRISEVASLADSVSVAADERGNVLVLEFSGAIRTVVTAAPHAADPGDDRRG